MKNLNIYAVAIFSILLLGCNTNTETSSGEIAITFSSEIPPSSYSGRAFIVFSEDSTREPLQSMGWFNHPYTIAEDFAELSTDDRFVFSENPIQYPFGMDSLDAGTYFVQALMDVNIDRRSFVDAPGNMISDPQKIYFDPSQPENVSLELNQVMEGPQFEESEFIKELEVESDMLSEFYGRKETMKAGIALPADYYDSDKEYPTLYIIPGFGGRHYRVERYADRFAPEGSTEKVIVVLDPDTHTGHHVFADSDNNGPRGQALVDELIPAIEKQYRVIKDPKARLITGHSSGGWSSLWVQITYPEHFSGVWSTAPDPVDFRHFQLINMYEDENFLKDAEGNRIPVGRRNGEAILFTDGFTAMEEMWGHGGQMQSFEAVFGGRGPDGKPMQVWNREDGSINKEVVEQWKRYDISKILTTHWEIIEDQLAGKIHVYMGDEDTFYLEEATIKLKEEMENLGSDAVIELFPGKDHGTLMDSVMLSRIVSEMDQQLEKNMQSVD